MAVVILSHSQAPGYWIYNVGCLNAGDIADLVDAVNFGLKVATGNDSVKVQEVAYFPAETYFDYSMRGPDSILSPLEMMLSDPQDICCSLVTIFAHGQDENQRELAKTAFDRLSRTIIRLKDKYAAQNNRQI